MNRVYNFAAGPSMLPEAVLREAAQELLCYGNSGMSVMEMSHRSPEFESIIAQTEADLRKLLGVPDNYKVLFLQGGASTQFAAIPLNLINYKESKRGLYAVSGQFSKKAFDEAKRLGINAECIVSGADCNFSRIPTITPDMVAQDASYLHICFNNTIYGTTYKYIPEVGEVPLVADMSSFIMSEPVDVSKFGVIYAGAQKNMAPAGVTLVIVREDLLGHQIETMPTMLDWSVMAKNDSLYNTPPCYTIYMAGLVYKWLLSLGGLDVMKEMNAKKAAILYDYLDSQSYYIAPVDKTSRSMMNVTFVTGDAALDKKFAAEATEAGLKNLKGHRSVGGMRASIYNAMPTEGVAALVEFMDDFAKKNPKEGN